MKLVTKKTYTTNVKKFAKRREDAFRKLNAFVETNWKSKKAREKHLDEIATIIDEYIQNTVGMMEWCHKNDMSTNDFVCDVVNSELR